MSNCDDLERMLDAAREKQDAVEEQLHAMQTRLIYQYITGRIHQDIVALVLMDDATGYQRDPEAIAKFEIILMRIMAQYEAHLRPLPTSYLLRLRDKYRDCRTPSEELWRLTIIEKVLSCRDETQEK